MKQKSGCFEDVSSLPGVSGIRINWKSGASGFTERKLQKNLVCGMPEVRANLKGKQPLLKESMR
ncbi:MAG: hypothetical protein A2156_09800 [Deltaproteobacteria bacterium RBG_16_48_10]|nr:MAG: hypothetical protein A2156_09800 [Deltaproteobacteria bacterium RBG_16_48_10]